jgi:hypothetical protein
VGRLCRYRSVVTMLAWPRRSLTTCRFAPPARSQDVSVAEIVNSQPGQPGGLPRRVPHLTAEPVGRDMTVGRPGPGGAGAVLTGSPPGSPVTGVGTAAVLAPALRGVVGREGPVPVPSAVAVRIRHARRIDCGQASGHGSAWGLVTEQQVVRPQPTVADVGRDLGGDLGAELEPPVFLVRPSRPRPQGKLPGVKHRECPLGT